MQPTFTKDYNIYYQQADASKNLSPHIGREIPTDKNHLHHIKTEELDSLSCILHKFPKRITKLIPSPTFLLTRPSFRIMYNWLYVLV